MRSRVRAQRSGASPKGTKQSHLNGAKASVIGLGKSGMASCRLLRDKGVEVFASDKGDIDKEILNALKTLDIEFEAAGHTDKCFEKKDFIITSPGISLDSFPLNEAGKRGIPIYSEIELGFWFIDTPILAVTGTNGKTTTVTLLAEMLKAMGKEVILCGNIGLPLCNVALERRKADLIVMEVSSFQLETIRDFRPHVGVLLNISPNHLDRYCGDISAYSRAKTNLFKNQVNGDFAVLNADDERVRETPVPAQVKKIYFSTSAASLRAPLEISSCGFACVTFLTGQSLQLPGTHNLSNALAASHAISCLFPEDKKWVAALRQFKGLPHRLETVRNIRGVTFINDSKSTSVDAALKAIESISGPVILIAGGRDKDSPFDVLRDVIATRVKRLILIGEAKDKIAHVIRGATQILTADTLEQAVLLGFKEAQPGDNVLLSPACSSFDMFRNFEERGEKFKEIVNIIASQWKQPTVTSLQL